MKRGTMSRLTSQSVRTVGHSGKGNIPTLEAESYNAQSTPQKIFANEFFVMFKDKLGWNDLSNDTVMELGCGTGNSSTELILTNFPNVKKIIAIDGSEDMIRVAKSKNFHQKVEYFVADLQNEFECQRWFSETSKIVSIFCFNWMKEQTKGFQNVFNLLKPGGEACLLFVLNAYIYKALEDVTKISKWKDILKDTKCYTPDSQVKNWKCSHYVEIFSDIGFDVILCEEKEASFSFPSPENYKKFMGSLNPFIKHIPVHLMDEFEDDLYHCIMKYNCESSHEKRDFVFTSLRVLLRKPLSTETSRQF